MPESNRLCFACGYMRPAKGGKSGVLVRAGRAVWFCRECKSDPNAGLAKRKAAQEKLKR